MPAEEPIRVLLISRAALHPLRSTDLAWPSITGLPPKALSPDEPTCWHRGPFFHPAEEPTWVLLTAPPAEADQGAAHQWSRPTSYVVDYPLLKQLATIIGHLTCVELNLHQ